MKIKKEDLDKLIIEAVAGVTGVSPQLSLNLLNQPQTLVSANPFSDPLNPEKVASSISQVTKATAQQPKKTEKKEVVDPNKVQIDKNVLNSLSITKEEIRRNMNKLPLPDLITKISLLIDQLNFLDEINKK